MFSSTLIELSSQCDMDDIVQRFSTFTDNLFRAVLNLSAVQVETMPSFKRKKVLHALGGVDLRVQLLQLFLTRWNQLSHEVKRKFVPGLVNKVMRVFDINIVEPKLTEKAVDIYYNLLAVEFEDKKSFDACEGETQKSLVEFKIDDRFKDAFIEGMRQKFIREQEQQEKISIAGLQLLDRISTMLVQVEEIQKYADTDEDEKTQVCIEVMHSFLSKENLDLYFKYVHILSKMHVNLGSFVEAALTLQTHCDRLSFSSDRILPYFSEEYKEEKESRRRELMILRMIDLLDKGKDWERAITWCKELRKFYEETWQYQQLEELLKREGTFYTNIMTKKRFPAFFHVAFYGKGFRDIHLEGIYVYKSKELENHVEFANKMKKKYPQAELLTKPPQDVQALNERDGQFFEVFAISAITQREINNEYVARDPRRSPKIVKYEQLNNVTHLATARRYRESDEKAPNGYDFMDMHREIRIFRVPQPFPCERRRQKVVEVITIDLDPLENAIKDVEDKTLDLQDSVISHRLDARPDTNELSMHLTGVIDAPVNGGMGKYIEYFFGEEYIKTHPNCKPLLVRFAKALQAQLEILKDGLYYRRYFSSGKALALSDHLERLYAKMVEDCKGILEKYL
jgi:dedicator of cytokinesis protein 3